MHFPNVLIDISPSNIFLTIRNYIFLTILPTRFYHDQNCCVAFGRCEHLWGLLQYQWQLQPITAIMAGFLNVLAIMPLFISDVAEGLVLTVFGSRPSVDTK